MLSKWMTVLVSVVSVSLLCVGVSVAQDDGKEPDLEKVMESVNKANNTIRKTVRTAVAYKKGMTEANDAAKELVKLATDAKKVKSAAEKQKKDYKEWVDLSDKFIKASEELVTTTTKDSQPDAKTAFAKVTKTCTDCHNAFRVEEDPFE